jgi:hypothetical protein
MCIILVGGLERFTWMKRKDLIKKLEKAGFVFSGHGLRTIKSTGKREKL